MRESNSTFPAHNRAVVSITHLLYDRRALDTNSSHALLNNLTSLTYLTSTSPRIREILTVDGGLERLLDILRDSCLPHEPTVPDYWGLNGPCTARTINVDRAISLRHSLAFQCVVNIGVRGSETIRTRVVQAGALDIVAQILESWLKKHGIAIFSNPLGSQMAVDSVAAGVPIQAYERRRHRSSARHHHTHQHHTVTPIPSTNPAPVQHIPTITPPAAPNNRQGGTLTNLVASIANLAGNRFQRQQENPRVTRTDTDVDMADAEADVETDGASIGPEDVSMDVDDTREVVAGASNQATTPRAQQHVLPLPIAIPTRSSSREVVSQASSTGASLSSEEPSGLVRARSENSLAIESSEPIPRPASGLAARLPQLADDQASNQSSPMGTPNRVENVDGMRARRGTIIGRPVNINLMPRNDRRPIDTDASEASDAPQETDLATATIQAGIAAANAQAAQAIEVGGQLGAPNPPADEPEIVAEAGNPAEEPDQDAFAAEQARIDLEAGAPPGQPGAVMQTPRVATNERATTRMPGVDQPPEQPAQIIIANGAPRAFQDLASYVGISSLLHPEVDQYSDDNILLALQLLAYLSKYPHVRASFHRPRRPMHPTFNYGDEPLPERPPCSETPNIFSLVERYTFRPSPSDPMMFRIPAEIQYWAGVIMRNACRKDDAQGGIRQCANMSCGRWESYPREFAKCRRCRKAKYCSKECQSKAWSEGHRFWCNVRSDQEPGAGESGNPPGGGRRPRGDDDDDDVDVDSPNGGRPGGGGISGGAGGGGGGGATTGGASAGPINIPGHGQGQTRQTTGTDSPRNHIPSEGVFNNTGNNNIDLLSQQTRTIDTVNRLLGTYGVDNPNVPTELTDRPRPSTPSPDSSRNLHRANNQSQLGSPALVNRRAMARSNQASSSNAGGTGISIRPGPLGSTPGFIPAELERIMNLQRPLVSSPLAAISPALAPVSNPMDEDMTTQRITLNSPTATETSTMIQPNVNDIGPHFPFPTSATSINNSSFTTLNPAPITPPTRLGLLRRASQDDHDVPTTPPARHHAERHVRPRPTSRDSESSEIRVGLGDGVGVRSGEGRVRDKVLNVNRLREDTNGTSSTTS